MPTVELSEITLEAIGKMVAFQDKLVKETGGRWGGEKSYDYLIRNAVVFWLFTAENKKLHEKLQEYMSTKEGFSSEGEFRKRYFSPSE